ncbi:type I restriction-modification system subunit M [Moritella viscosa]|uniref:site-specific DNA-methyltransferase (adenine-specific) n=1 Tax=Moritella viscosa TaxID=80854 RepID=A0A1L0CA87_9GAMM|nr:class I SAM-dependent DNA methyltransferase [Moritella viscosa]SGZ18585.1 Putative type I restriction enzyme M protein [Moritella viscosa]SHO14496.1 Putative type I restriction enzyme M protein [Moritella viscosa]SHO15338.1 Putative type I restriction enzyme M protein [Moritella viscosa]SHO18047.1 Putative type I restriction enzyme M protein [Moritella viscosa]SHO18965.1 Putative type I restriction enzyme M protein [Moritella viscosa]
MITGTLKSKVDKLWEEFWTGGITNPLTVVEQITYLMYARMLDMNERNDEKRQLRTKKDFSRRFGDDVQHIRWENFRHLGAEKLYPLVKDELFPHFKTLASEDTLFAEFMKDAQLMIQKPSLLVKAVELVSDLPLENKDVKGDLYEYLLSKLTTAGINGQFRTPRHIIRAMIEMLDVEETHRICDPACGTGGFLSTTYEYLLEKYSSAEGIEKQPLLDEHDKPLCDDKGEPLHNMLYSGDLIENRKHIDTDMFHGFDFDATMLRVAAMNLVMHGVKQPDIHYQDTLSQRFIERFPKEAKEGFDIILANPPFKGSLDEEDVDPAILKVVKTKKTELLFVALIQRMLKVGGRSATVVPDGVLFGSSKAHQALRKHLIEDNQLEAVISLPSGVFRPYAGVSTAILIFTKGGNTDKVWFYDVQADGRSLDDKRTPINDNDLPDLVKQYKAYQAAVMAGESTEQWSDKKQKAFLVAKDDIKTNKYDLSINRYKEVVYEQESYEEPKVILGKLKALENEILADLNELELML